MNEPETDFDFTDENAPVATQTPPPQTNGTQHNRPQVVGRTIVEKFAPDKPSSSMTTPGASLMDRVNNRPSYAGPKEKEKDDREFLDDFNLKAEAEDYQLSIVRSQPSVNSDGEPVPTGVHSKIFAPIMSYDELVQRIIDSWGGGVYRVVFAEQNGRRADSIQRAIIIQIPTTQHPPKREQNERIEPRPTKATATGDDVSAEERQREREHAEKVKEERRQEADDKLERAKMKRELDKLKYEKELAEMRDSLMKPKQEVRSAELQMLEKRLEEEKLARAEAVRKAEEDRKDRDRKYEDEKKEAQRRYEDDKKEALRRAEDDRKMFMDGLNKLSEKLAEVSNRPLPLPPPNDSMEKIMAIMAPIVTAIVTKPPPLLPDNKEIFIELNKAQSESTKQIASMTQAMLAAPKTDPGAPMLALMMKFMEKADGGKDNLLNNLITTMVGNKSELTPELMIQFMERGEKSAERFLSMRNDMDSTANEDSGFDPALGFLGNAGKAVFDSLKGIVQAAASNPQLIEAVTKMFGSRNPTNQQLAYAAYQMEHGGVPPAFAPQVHPMPQQSLPGTFEPMNQQAIPISGPPPMQHPHAQRPMPPPMHPAPAQAGPTQQQVVASELEGATTGLPSNADPEQMAPRTPEELADDNLRDAVTTTVEIMVGEGINKPTQRTWPEDATNHWPKHFIKAVVDCHDNGMRLRMIGEKCDRDVAIKLNTIWQQDHNEQNIFWQEMIRFVEMNRVPVQAAHAPAQTAPPMPPMVAPPPVPVVPGV